MAINFHKSRTNISIRDEFNDLLEGEDLGLPTGTPFVVKLIKIDPVTEIPLPCDCLDPATLEPDKDLPCPKCAGSGYLFDEKIYYGWKFQAIRSVFKNEAMEIGSVGADTYSFYFRMHDTIYRSSHQLLCQE